MEVLKKRLTDKVSEIQRDASTVQSRLDEQARLQTSLDRWKQKLQVDLDQAFSRLQELIERRKQELTNKVDKMIAEGRRMFTQQNSNCRDCLASVDKYGSRGFPFGGIKKACDEANKLLKEDNKTTFLATHNKVSQQLEECFVELLMLEETDSCSSDVINMEHLERCFREFSLMTEDCLLSAGMVPSSDVTAGDDNERENQVSKQTVFPEIPSLNTPVDVNSDKTVDSTTGHAASQYSASVTSVPSLASSCSHTDDDTFVSRDRATSDSENSIAAVCVSFANIPVSVQAPFTFMAAPHSHLCPVSVDSSLFSLPASTVSTSAHNSNITANISSPLAAPTTDLKISVTTEEFDPFSVVCSSSSLVTQASSAFSTIAIMQSTTVPNSISLPVVASVAKALPSEYTLSHSGNVTKTCTAVWTPITTSSQGSAMQTTCAVSTVANTSSTIKTTPPKKASSRKTKTTSSASSAVVTIKSSHRSTNNATIGYIFDLKQGDELECVITEVVSPSEFWVQPVGYELISLMNSMGSYYKWLEKDGDYGGLKEPPRVGDFCCARFSQDMRWYRARVLSFIHDRVEVLYVDYGNKEEVPLSSLRPLDYRFVILPCQAIKCSLKVRPAVEISAPMLKDSVVNIPLWPKHTKKWLKSLLMGKHATVLFLTTATSNHAQVDIAVTRENFLSSLSCLHGVLSIGEGIKQFLQSTQLSPLYALCGVSKFMCAVKLAVANGEKPLSNKTTVMPFSASHSFSGSSVFPFPTPTPSGSVFLRQFPTMPQYSLFPFMVHPNPPQPLFSPGFIQPVVSPPPSSSFEFVDTIERRCQSENNDDSRNCQTPKKRSASLTAAAALTLSDFSDDVQQLGSNKTKVKKLSSSEGKSSTERISPPSGTHVTSELDTELSDQSLLIPSLSSEHSNSNLSSSTISIDVTTLSQVATAVPTSTTSPLLSSRNSSISSVPTTSESPKADNSTVTFSSPSVAVMESHHSSPTTVVSIHASPKFHNIAALPILSSVISDECHDHNVIISHVVSPSEFYLNFLSDVEEIKPFDSFQKLLNEHYLLNEEKEAGDDLSTLLSVGLICCAKFTDGTWNRAIVRDIKPKESSDSVNKYLIQYVDFGNYQWVAVKDIQPLKEEFLSQPALTVRCTLVGVVPCNDRRQRRKKTRLSSKVLMTAAGAEDDFLEECDDLSTTDRQQFSEPTRKTEDGEAWSQEALDWFTQLTGKMLVATLTEEVMMLSWDDSLQVKLIDTNGSIDVSIAEDLVSKGLAKYNAKKMPASKGNSSTEIPHLDQVNPVNELSPSAVLHADNTSTPKVDSDTLSSPTEVVMDAWNPMESHFLSNWNLYQNTGDHTSAGRGSLFRTRGGKQEAGFSDGTAISKSWKMQTVPLPAENTCVPVVITGIYSPVRFWVQLFPSITNPDEVDDRNVCGITLSQLCEEMNKECSRSVFKGRESDIIAHGELVAAMSPEDRCWYRAVLKDYDDNTNSVLVAFVDFGDTAWIKETNIRRLHSKFLHLPIQAVECTLDGMKLNEDVDFNWAMEEVLEMVKDKAFAAHIIERDTVGNRLSLDLYEASSIGISVNLKDEMVTREIALRNTTKNSVSNSIPGRYQKASSLPG
ncbi:uncharacterized protein [Dysidea avara]|uniref:uncharacterized protein isoform X2 n=1 Tax=Dysidea avara TaxID=196820 RepID=UPI003319E57C